MIRDDEELRAFYNEGTSVSHPTDALLLEWTNRLRDGERGPAVDGIARYIIKDFQLRQFLGVPQSDVTLEWLGEALGAILEYSDPLQTLGLLPRPKKRPADPQRGWDVACWVTVTQKRGYSRAEAIQSAAQLFCMDESNVRKLVKAGPEWMNPDQDIWDEYFQLRNRPLPLTKSGKK
jgi:hypothetical protein